jgi:hypothetical protein
LKQTQHRSICADSQQPSLVDEDLWAEFKADMALKKQKLTDRLEKMIRQELGNEPPEE